MDLDANLTLDDLIAKEKKTRKKKTGRGKGGRGRGRGNRKNKNVGARRSGQLKRRTSRMLPKSRSSRGRGRGRGGRDQLPPRNPPPPSRRRESRRSGRGVGKRQRRYREPNYEREAYDEYDAPSFSRNSGRSVTTDTITIEGLRPSVTSDDIKEIFEQVGVTTRAFVIFGSDGRSSGCAEVKYTSGNDAREAVRRFDGVSVDERPIRVTLGTSTHNRVDRYREDYDDRGYDGYRTSRSTPNYYR